MKFLSRRSILQAGIACVPLAIASRARSDDSNPGTDLLDLSDEPSRAALFEDEVIPAGLAEEATPAVAAKSLALPPIFYLPDDARWDRIENHARKDSLFGIDISHYTDISTNVFKTLRFQRVRFVYVKATQGTQHRDPKFSVFWKALGSLAPDVKISRGAYHFLSSESPGNTQAEKFVAYVTSIDKMGPNDMPPVIDLEWDRTSTNADRWRGRGSNYIIDNVNACVQRVKELTGRQPIIYTAKSWFGSSTIPIEDFTKIKGANLWWADYNTKRKFSETPAILPGAPNVLWQFTDRAQITAGFSGGLDTSVFYGSEDHLEDDFRTTFGLGS